MKSKGSRVQEYHRFNLSVADELDNLYEEMKTKLGGGDRANRRLSRDHEAILPDEEDKTTRFPSIHRARPAMNSNWRKKFKDGTTGNKRENEDEGEGAQRHEEAHSRDEKEEREVLGGDWRDSVPLY